jgi:putative membrane protein
MFINNLAGQLVVLGSGLLVLAYAICNYLRKGMFDHGAEYPLILLGVLVLITGLDGLFTWTLPGPYNMLFYDLYPLAGILLIGFGIFVKYGGRLEYLGFLSLLFGIATIVYGYYGYVIGLTNQPIALLGLYGSIGLAAILAFPFTLLIDRGIGKKKQSKLNFALGVIFLIFLIFGALLALYIGFTAIHEHLITPP